MKNTLLLTLFGLAALISSPATSTDENAHHDGTRLFTGLWEGVDPIDGSLTQRSISCDWRTSRCQILGSDSFWFLCGSPRGILRGEGRILGGELSVPQFTLTCTETEEEFVVDTRFVLDRRNRTLLEEHLSPNFETFVFHKTDR